MWALQSLILLCWEAQKKNSLVGRCIEKKEINKLNTVSTKRSWSTWCWRVDTGMGWGIDCFHFFLLRSFRLFFSFQDSQFTPHNYLQIWDQTPFMTLATLLPVPKCRPAEFNLQEVGPHQCHPWHPPESAKVSFKIHGDSVANEIFQTHQFSTMRRISILSSMVRYIDFSKSCPLLGVGKDVHFFMMFCKNSGTRHPSEKPGVGGHRILAPRRI